MLGSVVSCCGKVHQHVVLHTNIVYSSRSKMKINCFMNYLVIPNFKPTHSRLYEKPRVCSRYVGRVTLHVSHTTCKLKFLRCQRSNRVCQIEMFQGLFLVLHKNTHEESKRLLQFKA